jgi:acyl carrier protein
LSPKVDGTLALARALEDHPLDFLVLCSSTTSLTGGGGQVDYCGANAFLDAFARAHARQSGTFTVSVNWDAWRDVGMAVDTAVPDQIARERAAILLRGIAPEEGVEAFRRILAHCTVPQIAVTPAGLAPVTGEATAPACEQEAATGAVSTHPRPHLSVEYVEPSNDVERALCEIWQELLGIDRVGVHDDFFELGGHSLMATQIVSRVRERCALDVSLKDFFEAATISMLANASGGGRSRPPKAPVSRGSVKREEFEIA